MAHKSKLEFFDVEHCVVAVDAASSNDEDDDEDALDVSLQRLENLGDDWEEEEEELGAEALEQSFDCITNKPIKQTNIKPHGKNRP